MAPPLSSTDTLLVVKFGTARSGLPSPLKSPTATVWGLMGVVKLVGPLKLPVPEPSKIDTSAELLFTAARSSLPSPLKSPTAKEWGVASAAKLVAALKLPVPVPSKIDTSLDSSVEVKFATARSSSRSLLKLPAATEQAAEPATNLVDAAKVPARLPKK